MLISLDFLEKLKEIKNNTEICNIPGYILENAEINKSDLQFYYEVGYKHSHSKIFEEIEKLIKSLTINITLNG